MKLKHEHPCRECPFRRASAPGYTGAATAKELLATTQADHPMPCHMTVDYNDPAWKASLETDEVSYCAGALIFFRNQCKMSRDRTRPQLPADHAEVFSWPAEFLAYHDIFGAEDDD